MGVYKVQSIGTGETLKRFDSYRFREFARNILYQKSGEW